MPAKLPPPCKAAAPALDAAMSASQAFQAILRSALDQLENNRCGVAEGEDIEYVHQARVAIRRLRSALRLLAAEVPEDAFAALSGELRWLGAKLGGARDWDVFAMETLPPLLQAHPASAELVLLRAAAERLRSRHRAAARKALQSARGSRLLQALADWVAAEGWRPQASRRMDAPAAPLAARLLSRRHQALKKRGRHLVKLPPLERHAARIAAKKLRYAAEFFLPLFPAASAKPFIKSLSALQDSLGLLNDTVVTGHLLQELRAAPGLPDLTPAMALVEARTAQLAAQGLARLDGQWADFCRQAAFWRAPA